MAKKLQPTTPENKTRSWPVLGLLAVVSGVVSIAIVALQDNSQRIALIEDISTSASSAADVLTQLYLNALDHGNDSVIGDIVHIALPDLVEPYELIPPLVEVVEEAPPVVEVSVEETQEIAPELENKEAGQVHQRQQAEIIQWMMSEGASFPEIEIVELPELDEYRGVVAKSDIAADEILARIPERFIITYRTARNSTIGKKISEAVPSYDDREYAHYMISLFLVQERALGDASWWAPYIRTLPVHFQNMPINFNPEEVQLLEKSRLGFMHAFDTERFQTDYKEICDALPDFCEEHSYELYKWARLAVRSRAFSLSIDGVDESALMPFVDMINHDFDNLASWRFNDDFRQGQIYARKNTAKGTAITITYGAKSNRVLLRTYGFAMADNPHYGANVYIQLPDGEAASGVLAKRVEKSGNPDTEFYRISHTLTLSTDDEGFRAALKLCRVAVATRDELDTMESADEPFSLRNEAEALRYLEFSIDAALYKFAENIEEDEALLASSTLNENERNTILTRHSEKETMIKLTNIIGELMPLVDQAVSFSDFNKHRYHSRFSPHLPYVRKIVDLRRRSRSPLLNTAWGE